MSGRLVVSLGVGFVKLTWVGLEGCVDVCGGVGSWRMGNGGDRDKPFPVRLPRWTGQPYGLKSRDGLRSEKELRQGKGTPL